MVITKELLGVLWNTSDGLNEPIVYLKLMIAYEDIYLPTTIDSMRASLKICLQTIAEAIVMCSCHLCLHACNRSLFARRLSIDSRVYVINQHVHWPIRAPLPTYANQDAWVVITPKRTKANSNHTAAWHAWTRTPPLNIVLKAVFSLIHCPASFIRLWQSCHSDLGGSRHGWGLFLEQTCIPRDVRHCHF